MNANNLRQEIVRISRLFYERGWCRATSGNFSVRIDSNQLLITASGKDKGLLTEQDILLMNMDGTLPEKSVTDQPSAEAELHCALYRTMPLVRAILHTHSIFANVLTVDPQLKAPLTISGHEMLKALSGVSTHLHTEHIPVLANDQNIPALSARMIQYLQTDPAIHGFLIGGHGLYSWGVSLTEALRHTEAFEFLLECEYRKLSGK